MRRFLDLYEAPQTLVFAFGRFNPPTTGHEKLINKVASVAGSNPYRIYPSFTTNPKKDPLPHALKVAYMRKMFPKHKKNIIADTKMKTAIFIAEAVYKEGFKNLIMVVGSDRVKEFSELLTRYNDAPDKSGNQLFKFDSVKVVSAGERDPDSEGVDGMSASKMRDAAAKGDKDSFLSGVPSSFKDGEKLYRDVRKYMGIREERDMGDMSDFETVRDMYLTGKIWNAGDIVEAKGISGEVVRKGTNYLSFVDEDGKVHKAWLHEIELNEKYDSDKFFSGKGTPEQRLQLLKLQNKALRALGGSPKQKAIKKEIDALRKKMGMKVKEEIELDERNYEKEYANYQGKPEQIERRSSRNKARRIMGDKTKVGMDVGHKDNNPMNNNPENLKNEDPSKNRREPRLREMDEDVYDTFPWLRKAKDYLFTKTHKKGMNKVALSVATEFAKQQKAGKNPNPINIIHDISKGIIGVTDRMVVTYINDLIKKGKLPKDLRAEYEPQNETLSFKDFVNQIQINEVKQDSDIKDKKGTQPAKYYAGDMAKSTKDKRDAHFRKKKSGPAPGDADAKTKPSVHTKKFKQMFGEVLPDTASQKDYIDDFEKSDAPQFQGKSKEKRREMAIAAYLSKNEDGPCWDTHKQVGMKKKSGRMVPNCVPKNEEPRIPRKKGQPAGSDKHSDLYTDENPVGTIQGLGFKDVDTAKASVKKIIGSGKTHAHKIQAAIAMEQRAKEMGKTAEAAVYRAYIDKMKKKTKEMQKEDAEDDRLQKTIKVATAKANLGKRLKQMKVQQKTSLKNVRDKDQKKARSNIMKQQIKRLKDSGKRDIKQIQKEETELNEWGEVTEKDDKSGKELNNPTRGDVKKYKVYVKNKKGNVVKVEFGDPNMSIKRDDPERRKAFRARHNCDQKKDKTTAGYWSCKFWSTKSVTDLMKG